MWSYLLLLKNVFIKCKKKKILSTNFNLVNYLQSRSSLYAEYTQAALGPRNTRGPLALKDDFILVSF